jgi:hypothetical protein
MHTPGPWKVKPSDSAYGTYWLLNVEDGDDDCDDANAKLMAASPNLLLALENIIGSLEDDHQTCVWCEDDESWDGEGHISSCLIGLANAAISEAKGE